MYTRMCVHAYIYIYMCALFNVYLCSLIHVCANMQRYLTACRYILCIRAHRHKYVYVHVYVHM